jgi:glutamate synthase domain-containing protein 1
MMIKQRELRRELGSLVTPMLDCMGTRGPDSAGLAVFAEPLAEGTRRFSLFVRDSNFDWEPLFDGYRQDLDDDIAETEATSRHATIATRVAPQTLTKWLGETHPNVHLLSVGNSIDVYKDEGHPRDIAERYRFAGLQGTHAVGHTRMATESAVSPAHAHPFTAGEDFCLVHNGSLSNPYSIRRKLEKKGIHFETDNDTEAGCRFLEWRMSEGDTLEEAIRAALRELDGFFTFLMATADTMLLVRDPFACKPAVVAETDDYVAVGSEFRSLAKLPGIKQAEVYEPAPEEIYSWKLAPGL